MKKIRHSTFETNSSSSHSLVLNSDNFVLDEGFTTPINITGGEFGWNYFKHNDVLTKANYLAQRNWFKPEYINLLKEVILDITNEEAIIDKYNLDNGYVDHESSCNVSHTHEDIKNFIFNKNSWLFGGNDNSTPKNDFYDVEVYNKDGSIIYHEYKYLFKLNRTNLKIRFKEFPTNNQIEEALDAFIISYKASADAVEINPDYCFSRENVFKYTGLCFQEMGSIFLWQDSNYDNGFNNLYEKKFGKGAFYSNVTLEEYQEMINAYPKHVYEIKFSIEKIENETII